jgi:uncharacterized membrane protein YvlD (DUF360 family)
MTGAILTAVLLAVVAGAFTGFGKRWEESLLLAGLIVPLVGAIVAWVMISLSWGLLTFFWSFLAASITWGGAACIRHAVDKLRERPGR